MSVGQIVGGAVGAVIGFFAGGPAGAFQGAAIGMGIGGALFPPPGPDGPRLQDLKPQSSSYGNPIIYGYGTIAVQGTVIWASDLVEKSHEEGGKGSGGGSTVFTYFGNFAVGLVEAPAGGIAGVSRIWAGPDKRLIYDITPGANLTSEGGTIRVFDGAETQMPSALQESYLGVGNVPAYRGLAYVELEMFPLARDHNTIPFLLVEVVMNGNSSTSEVVRFGESNCADIDPSTGYIWTNPSAGHAELDGVAGYDLLSYFPKAQVQTYDPIKRELVGFQDTPMFRYYSDSGVLQETIYPSSGALLHSGGKIFVGSGYTGWDIGKEYPLGMVFDCKTRRGSMLTVDCLVFNSFNGVFYWPTVPIPAIDNNGVYFAGGNGIGGGYALCYMPASVAEYGKPDYDPIPDRTGAFDTWVTPVGWTQKVAKGTHCVDIGTPTPVTSITLPEWAFMAYVVSRPNVVLVLGYGGHVSLISDLRPVTGFSTQASGVDNVGVLPMPSNSDVAPVAYDPNNECGWAFAGENNQLYKIIPGSLLDMEFILPEGSHVIACDFDKGSGQLRLLTNKGYSASYVVLYDPTTNTITETVQVNLGPYSFIPSPTKYGRAWNIEKYRRLIYNDGNNLWSIPYGPTLEGTETLLSEVVTDLHIRAGMTGDQIDASALTDVVDGYQIARQSSVRSCIDTLRPVYFFDAVESSGVVKYVKRGSASSVTIPDDDLGARLSSDSPVEPLRVTRQMENELPAGVSVSYQLKATDYDLATKYQQRLVGASGEQATMQLPLVLTDEKAQQVADVNTFAPWMARLSFSLSLPRKYSYLEPTDVVTAKGYIMRITKITETPHGILQIEAIQDDIQSYVADSIVTETPADTGTVADPVLTNLALMDVNLLRDTDDGAGFYVAASGANTPWTSAELYRSIDGGSTYSNILSMAQAATMGHATNSLGDFQNNIFDEINSVNVRLSYGALSSATESAVLNGANVAVLGDEILQFKTVTLESDGSYTITGLLRGRRGTEWAAAKHQDGDQFVLMTTSTVYRPSGTTAELGLARPYKPVTAGATIAATASQGFTNAGAGLKPYAPVQIGAGRTASDDLVINWVRRSRLAGEWRDYVDVPLSELTEAYQVDIVSAENAILRTLYSTTPTVTYSATDQLTDLGVVASMYNVAVTIGDDAHASQTSAGHVASLFDPSSTDGWICNGFNWVEWEFLRSIPLVEAYRITEFPTNPYASAIGFRGPVGWTLEVSDDGVMWRTVDTIAGEPGWSDNEVRTYTLTTPVRAKFWRINITAIEGGAANTMMRRFELVNHFVNIAVYEMSAVVGRGYPGIAAV